jgi:hypothetical protein
MNPANPNQNRIDSSKIPCTIGKFSQITTLFGISNLLYKVELGFIEGKGNYLEYRIKKRIENRK